MKIRTRKRTAAEREWDKKRKEEKKALKKEKREIKKEARQDKKEARKDAREDKKAIRKSDMDRKEKKEAKKDIRQDKKETVKDIKADKKSDVKEVKRDLKEVRQSLEIILPVKTANVALLREDLRDINFNDGSVTRPLTIDDAHAILNRAFDRSLVLAERGLDYVRGFANLNNRSSWIADWNGDALLVQWFGEVDKVNQVSDVFNRLNSVVKRLNKKITIRLHPQRKSTRSAQNNGTFFEPKMFKVFPRLIEKSLDSSTKQVDYDIIASIMIHEMVHLMFFDQKLDGEKVYGHDLAEDLAKRNPKKARKSPENYEHFCLALA